MRGLILRTIFGTIFGLSLGLGGGNAIAQRSGFGPQVQEALRALKQEPSIQEAQRAALEFFRIDQGTVGSMRSRAAWKSLLPTIGVKGRYNESKIDIDKFDAVLLGDLDQQAGRDISGSTTKEIQASGTWDLSRLVFNPETLDVSSLVVLQEAILKEITRLYYTRRRLQVDLIINPPNDPATQLSKELRVEELTATLDAMTGNLFTRHAKQGKRRRRRRE